VKDAIPSYRFNEARICSTISHGAILRLVHRGAKSGFVSAEMRSPGKRLEPSAHGFWDRFQNAASVICRLSPRRFTARSKRKSPTPALLDAEFIMNSSFQSQTIHWSMMLSEKEIWRSQRRYKPRIRTIRSENNIPPDKKGRSIMFVQRKKPGTMLRKHVT